MSGAHQRYSGLTLGRPWYLDPESKRDTVLSEGITFPGYPELP